MQKPTKEKITSEGSREDDRDVLRGRSNRFFARCIFMAWIEPWVFLGNVVAASKSTPRRCQICWYRMSLQQDGRRQRTRRHRHGPTNPSAAGNERRPRFAVHRTKWPFDGRFLTF
jgi:hypothetical protein